MSGTTVKVNLLEPTTAPDGTKLTPAAAVTTTVYGAPAVIPMSTLRKEDGTDGMVSIEAIGTKSDTAWSGTGDSSVVAVLKAIWIKLGTALNIRSLAAGTDSVTVQGGNTTAVKVSADALPLPEDAAKDTSVVAVNNTLTTGIGVTNKSGTALKTSISSVEAGVILPTNLNGFTFAQSTANVTTSQLAAGATFTGTSETAFNQQGIQVMANADRPYTVAVMQYQDAGGTKMLSTSSFVRKANQPTNETLQVNGNFVKVSITNNGAASTTQLYLDTTFGPLAPLPVSLTGYGNQRMAVKEVAIDTPTYSFLTAPFTPAATPSDIVVIQGPPANSNTIYEILDLSIIGTATAAAQVDFFVVKRSTLTTGGASAVATLVPFDSANPASTVIVRHFTANPTGVGTVVGTVSRKKILLPIAGTAVTGAVQSLFLDKATGRAEQFITLRGPNECLCINFASQALPAGSANWYAQGIIRERTIG